ncbi:hypothetical protein CAUPRSCDRAFT_12548 [Caulochytrium protostelioides]|nr:hypothetical protein CAUPRSCDRAFT_12548 [Caulochytrium protostelioides]
MQNVLLQMGLDLMSLDGLRIQQVRTTVLRCHACFKIYTKPTLDFCPACGGATLGRVTARVDADGQMRVFLKKNYKYNLRGTIYAIPDNLQNQHGDKIILQADQKEYRRAKTSAQRQQRKARQDADLFESEFIFMDKKSTGSGVVIGHGRRNPNVARRRKC